MNEPLTTCYTAFAGTKRIAAGDLARVALAAKAAIDGDPWAAILIFEDPTSRVVELDFRGTPEEVLLRIEQRAPCETERGADAEGDGSPRRPGRPKLGVVAREVTLLPRHWDWLASQPGGASVALRKLVDQARAANRSRDRQRQALDTAYRFLAVMAGNEPGFEEATRALFAVDADRFRAIIESWPVDVRDHATKLAAAVFSE